MPSSQMDRSIVNGGFSVIQVLKIAFIILQKNAIPFLTQGAIATLLPMVASLALLGSFTDRISMLIYFFLQGIFGLAIQGSIAYSVYQVRRGNFVHIGEAFQKGMANLLPLLGVAIVGGLGIGIGAMLLIIPGIILLCMWLVAVPACVIERREVLSSLGRSAELTKGNRFGIFFLVIIVQVISVFFLFIGANVASMITGNLVVAQMIMVLFLFIPATFQYIVPAVAYFELRRLNENVAVETIIDIFD